MMCRIILDNPMKIAFIISVSYAKISLFLFPSVVEIAGSEVVDM